MSERLSEVEVAERLAKLNSGPGGDWGIREEKLAKTFQFRDFVEAFSFMTEVALVAERMNHHPEWFNVYQTVHVLLTTHDAGGISPLDFELAAKMNAAAAVRL